MSSNWPRVSGRSTRSSPRIATGRPSRSATRGSYFTKSPRLRKLVDDVFTRELRLTNGSLIQTYACTLRSLRAVSIPSGILDEVALYRLEGWAVRAFEAIYPTRHNLYFRASDGPVPFDK